MSDKIELNRRRVLGGLVTIGAAGAAVGAGTFAAFSDTENAEATVNAGTIELTVNDVSDIDDASVNIGPIAPDWSKSYNLDLGNSGSIDGDLYLKFEVTGNLQDDLDLTWDLDDGGSGSVDLDTVGNSWIDTEKSIPSEESVSGSIGLELPSDVGNDAQGESATITLTMRLQQDDAPAPDTNGS